MNDLTDITIFNASASCSKCTIRRQNEPISDRTTMQFLLNDQFALNAKRQKENEQKETKKKKTRIHKKQNTQVQSTKFSETNARTDLYTRKRKVKNFKNTHEQIYIQFPLKT